METLETKDYTAIIGRNAQGNWDAIDTAEKDDIWFHIDGVSSCHVILKNNDCVQINEIDKKIIKQIGIVCRSYKKSMKNAPCKIENIEKGKDIGSVTINGDYKKLSLK